MIEKLCILALVNILFYSKSICYSYVSDDIPSAQRPKHPNKWAHWLGVIEGRAKSWPQMDHFLTMIFHTLTSVMIYPAFGATDISFLAALLFSFNTANNQGSIWISGRSYVLPAFAMLSAMVLPVIGPIMLALGAWYNIGFFTPLVLAGSPVPWLALFMPLIWLIHGKRFGGNVKGKMVREMFDEDKTIKPEKLVLFTKTIGFYFVHGLIPLKNTFYHSFLQSLAGCGKEKGYAPCRFFWIGLFAIILIGYKLFFTPWDLVSFGLLWWFVGIAQFGNLFRIHQEIAERYMYLPNVGLMYCLASILYLNPTLSAFVIGMYATKTWFYMDAYQDDFYLTEQACINSPDSWFGWHVKAFKRWDAKSYNEAFRYWSTAVTISPKEFKVNINLATAIMHATEAGKCRKCNSVIYIPSVLAFGGSKEAAQKLFDRAMENIPPGQEAQASKLLKEWEQGKMAFLL